MITKTQIKKLVSLLVFIAASMNITSPVNAQGGSWVWVKGSNSLITSGAVYGVKGVADFNNTPRGLYQAACWLDLQGNFWIFGGVDSNNQGESDLWEYDPIFNTWTWINGPALARQPGIYGTQGVPSSTTWPGARGWGATTWTDNNGDLWLFGGDGMDSSAQSFGLMNDLWRYHIASGEWTWMKGPPLASQKPNYGLMQVQTNSNIPGARSEVNSNWKDANNMLWFFGGYGYDDSIQGVLNDLWRYDISTNQWTWMKGDSVVGGAGNYGSKNLENAGNLPPARISYTRWQDIEGNFYLFAGCITQGLFNDVWKFNPLTNNWTWIAGPAIPNDDTINYPAHCNDGGLPMTRLECRTPITAKINNLFWAFGGSNSYYGNVRCLNDLWQFNSETLQWKWISGPSTINDLGFYGILGIPDTVNLPPSRMGQCMWVDSAGNLWMFGGLLTYSDQHYMSVVNDVWEFIPDKACTEASGINEVREQQIEVYPNPLGAGCWKVDVNEELLGRQFNIFDGSGRLVYQSRINALHTEISPQLAGGMYLLRINGRNGAIFRKLIKL